MLQVALQNFDLLVNRRAQAYLSLLPALGEMTIWKANQLRKHLPNYLVASFKNGFFLLDKGIHTLKVSLHCLPPLPLPSTQEIKMSKASHIRVLLNSCLNHVLIIQCLLLLKIPHSS